MNKIANTYLMVFWIPFAVFGQEQTTESTQEKKIKFGIIGSIEYYNYDFINEDGTGLNYFKYKNKINYSAGISFLYSISKRIDVGAGLLYSEKGFNKIYDYNESPEFLFMETNYQIGYLDILVLARYNFILGEKINVHFGASAIPGFLVNNRAITNIIHYGNIKERNVDKSAWFNKPMAMSVAAGIGMRYNVGRVFRIGIEPYVKYHSTKFSPLLSKRPVSTGAQVSFSYRM